MPALALEDFDRDRRLVVNGYREARLGQGRYQYPQKVHFTQAILTSGSFWWAMRLTIGAKTPVVWISSIVNSEHIKCQMRSAPCRSRSPWSQRV